MDRLELLESIAYCGLICKLCHLAAECDGCKATASKCSAHSEREKGCVHRSCCITKGINGCWECEAFPCQQPMFTGRTAGEIKGFCRCMQEEGPDKFVEYIVRNIEKGIPYGIKGYGQRSENEVVELLRGSLED